ncbi:MAG: hypothetical protein EOO60_11145 [Hymenobacter sp.]|nr:MAG: hypothetical protein EOO60_11145 [Hymenobacter sp.]
MKSLLFSTSIALLLALSGCNNSSSTPAPSAREYTVEYSVSATGSSTASVIGYAGPTGNLIQLTNIPLPASYSFKRTLKQGDGLNIVASVAAPTVATSITATILLDGKAVQTQTGSSTGGGTTGTSATANISYVIP